MLINVRDHTIYSDKLRLCVVDLTQTALATKEDKAYKIDYWASLFKATTLEGLWADAEAKLQSKDAELKVRDAAPETKNAEIARLRAELEKLQHTT